MSDSRRTGLTLVLGPANSGKMGHVLAWWRERLPQKPVVVVPTAPDALEFSLEMAGRAGCLVGQSRALTFDGLVRLVVGQSPRYTADVERDLVLTRVLGETPLEALRDAVRFPGAVVALGRLLLQLAESVAVA